MSPALRALGIDRLSAAERIALAQEILDSVVAEQPPVLTEVKRQELERRLAAHLADPSDTVSWEQVEADTLARFRQ